MKNQIRSISRLAVVAIACGGLCLATSALATETTPEPNASKKEGPEEAASKKEITTMSKAAPKTSPPTAQLSDKDKAFIQTAAKGGMMEVEMGQMGEKQGQSAEVKKFSKRIVTDHTKANNELKALAAKKGVKLDAKHPKMSKMDAATFDKEFMAAMVTSHEKTISEFEAEAKGGSDADVKGWASKTLPTLKKHLAMAKEVQGKLK